ncbi:hypothetical protein BC938DRAFT_479029 [Jimgerdemannia flammicorona]|uniref:Uncharacterized protein n=1 Tax=Jimgerdemannia flammicorona TaxID=994334 RepID=A0A433QLS8_9FUNG|nr:hypothetical protein BC938DRAFT_479029 [Jimgerdemannia flammicorona]
MHREHVDGRENGLARRCFWCISLRFVCRNLPSSWEYWWSVPDVYARERRPKRDLGGLLGWRCVGGG